MTLSFISHVSLTPTARTVLDSAASYAARDDCPTVEPHHLLLALLDASGSLSVRVLRQLGTDIDRLRAIIGAAAPIGAVGQRELSEASRQVLLAAYREAQHLGHYQVDAIHLLGGILYDQSQPAAKALEAEGVSLYTLRQHLLAGPRRWSGYGWRSYVERARAAISVSAVFWTLLALWVASAIGLWFVTTDYYVRPLTMLFVISGWIVSLCIHEFGHALTAYLGGDESVRGAGYLSLNPLRYTNPLFSIILPLVFLLAGGIGLPGGAVFVNTAALRNTRWQRCMSAAGPLGTILCGILLIVPFWFVRGVAILEHFTPLWPALALLAFLQVNALIFNLLPVPPLDGFGMIEPSLSPALRYRLRSVGNLMLFVLFSLLWRGGPIAAMYWNSLYHFAHTLDIPIWLVSLGFDQFSGS